MIVEQFAYLSPAAMELRRRDGIPPWGVHPCEVGHFTGWPDDGAGVFAVALRAARELRASIEAI